MPSTRPPLDEIASTGRCSLMVAPPRFGGDPQRSRELAIVDLMVLRTEHGTGELAGKMRLAPARLRRRDPLQRQAELLLEHELMVQPGLVVRGQGDDQGSFPSQLHVYSRGLQELRGEGGPARLALAPERDQRFLAGLRLRAGRQHAGSGMTRAGAGGALVEHRD